MGKKGMTFEQLRGVQAQVQHDKVTAICSGAAQATKYDQLKAKILAGGGAVEVVGLDFNAMVDLEVEPAAAVREILGGAAMVGFRKFEIAGEQVPALKAAMAARKPAPKTPPAPKPVEVPKASAPVPTVREQMIASGLIRVS